MERFETILYLERDLRRSTRGLACALQAARDHGAALTVAGVVPAGPEGRRRGLGEGSAAAESELRTRPWRRAVPKRVEALRGHGVPVRVRLVEAAGVAAAAAEHDLVITVADRGSLRWPLRYAPAERPLLRGRGCPVWVLHPAQSPGVRVVVAGVDAGGADGDDLDREVLDTATALAEAAGAELYVVHAWSLLGESLIGSAHRGGSRRGVRRLLAATANAHRDRIQRLLESLDVRPPPTLLLRKASPVSALEDVAWRRGADVVVVGGSERAGLGTVLFPPTAEDLIGRVPCSVVTVREAAERRAASQVEVRLGHARSGSGGRVARALPRSRRASSL